MSKRSRALALRLEKGAIALEAYANALSEADWQTRVPHDGRKVGVVVHHVATMYPLEIDLARTLAAGQPIEGVNQELVDHITRHTPKTTTLLPGSKRLSCYEKTAPQRLRP